MLVGLPISGIDLPEGCLVAIIRRGEEIIVPGGDTVLRESDRITIIGDPGPIGLVSEKYKGG